MEFKRARPRWVHGLFEAKKRYGLTVLCYTVTIPSGEVLAGGLPDKRHKLVVAWVEIHQDSLMANWELAVNERATFKIRGLDQ